jgi:ABC-type branched-subunit amino acid transport system substrate-binding protein
MVQIAHTSWRSGIPCSAEQVQDLQERCEQAAYQERGGLLSELNRLRNKRWQENAKTAAALYGTGWVLAGATLVPIAEWVVRHFLVHRPARTWFQHKLGAPTTQIMYQSLCEVRNDGRVAWDQWLVDAFLADIDAYYHRGRRLNASRLPLLLLPHAKPGSPGGKLLERLRAPQAGTSVTRRSSPVVLAHTGDRDAREVVISDTVVEAARAPGGAAFRTPEVPADGATGSHLYLSASGPVTNVLSAVAMFALAAAGLSAGPALVGGLRCEQGLTLRPGLVERDGQCVGITDGHFADQLLPELTAVSRLIEKQNRAAAAAKSSVTIALMLPMTPDNGPERQQVLREVQGAYLAQYRANHGPELGDQQPSVRLLLANPGRDYAHWQLVTAQLHTMAKDPAIRLRAVVGFNLSVTNTEKALHYLTDRGIPVVGGPITADETENVHENGKPRFPGMARTVPTNRDQAKALVYANSNTKKEESVLVQDTRPGDSYNSSLANAFSRAVSPSTKPREFTSDGPQAQGNVANQFDDMVDKICYLRTRNIYFAGRPLHLRLFLHALVLSPCNDRTFQVITGSGASTLASYLSDQDWNELAARNAHGRRKVTLQYSAVGHPDTWARSTFQDEAKRFYLGERETDTSPRNEMETLQKLSARFGARLGERVSWEDSRAMTAHDSVWLAVSVMKRLMAGTAGEEPSLEDIRNAWRNTDGDEGVAGATGWLCLDNDGNPYNKAVSVVTLDPDRRSVRFEKAAWPERTPSARCEVRTGE